MKQSVATMDLALLFVALASPAAAQEPAEPSEPCRLELSGDTAIEWRGLYGRGYEVTGQEQDFEALPVTVRHEGAACDYIVVATPLSSGADGVLTGAGDRLSWDLLSTPNGPSLLSRDFLGSLATQIAGRFEAEMGAQPLSLFVTIPPGQFVRGGHYEGSASISAISTPRRPNRSASTSSATPRSPSTSRRPAAAPWRINPAAPTFPTSCG